MDLKFRTFQKVTKISVIILLLMAFNSFAGSTPSKQHALLKQLALDDWKEIERVNTGDRCNKAVQINNVEVTGMRVSDGIAEIIVVVTGDWNEASGLTSGQVNVNYDSRCGGFSHDDGKNQRIERRFFYKEFDTGWRLEGMRFFEPLLW